MQVHPSGIRYIRGVDQRIEWKTPGKRTVVHACANTRQVVIGLSGGEILYFELNDNGELEVVGKKELGHEIACMDIAPIAEGRQRARFLAVGDWNNTVRILSLYHDELFDRLSMQTVKSTPVSVCLLRMSNGGDDSGSSTNHDFSGGSEQDELFLSVGLQEGVLLRTLVDPTTGDLTDTRRRFLGTSPVKLSKVHLGDTGVRGSGGSAMVARSTKCWLCYSFQNKHTMTPLTYVPLESVTNFSSEQCAGGIVGYYENSLRILTIDRLGETFNHATVPVRYTPRQLVFHPDTGHGFVAQSEFKALSLVHDADKIQNISSALEVQINSQKEAEMADEEEEEEDEEEEVKKLCENFARQKSPEEKNSWASCVQVIDPKGEDIVSTLEMEPNEACFSIVVCQFSSRAEQRFVVVGSAVNVEMKGFKCDAGFISVYFFNPADGTLQLYHKTEIEGIPLALSEFQGKLLVGMGKYLRLYDFGKKKMLKKCENKSFPLCIRSIKALGNRIYVSDISESVHYVFYTKSENRLDIFADDFIPRWVTSSEVMDYDTVGGGDKFGNVFVLRLPKEVSEDVEQDKTGNKRALEHGYLNGAPNKVIFTISIFFKKKIFLFPLTSCCHSL